MNVLFLTNAMIDSDFASFQDQALIKPNPSNQVFYSKLIKAVALHNNVAVVSKRPLVRGMFPMHSFKAEKHSCNNVKYFYSHTEDNKAYKMSMEARDIMTSAMDAIESFPVKQFVVLVDTLKINLLKVALKIKKIYGVKIIGVLTDNPANLSYSAKTYINFVKRNAAKLDGYLSLSKDLSNFFNADLPSYEFEGLVEKPKSYPAKPLPDYFFFSGSLYERYGLKSLFDAFHNSNLNKRLLVAGSGPMVDYLNELSLEDERFLYLDQLPREKVAAYQMNAIANINPRPSNPKIDSQSVPSKLLEYLATGIPTISTKFPKLYEIFKDDVFWIENESADGIQAALQEFCSMNPEQIKKKAADAKRKVLEFYSIEVQGESISHFLTAFNSSYN